MALQTEAEPKFNRYKGWWGIGAVGVLFLLLLAARYIL